MIISSLINIFSFFNTKQKIKFYFLIFIMIFSAFLELTNVYLIFKFINLLTHNSSDYIPSGILLINEFFILENISNIILLIIFVNIITQLSLILNIYLNVKFSFDIGLSFSSKLINFYMERDYLNHMKSSASDFTNKIKDMTDRVISQMIMPTLIIISKVILTIPIIIFAFNINYKLSIIIITTLTFFYLIFFILVRQRIFTKSHLLNLLSKKNYKIIFNIFNLMNEIKINKIQKTMNNYYQNIYSEIIKHEVSLNVIRNLPRPLIEFIAVVILFLVFIFFKSESNSNFTQIAGVIGGLVIIMYKLLPAFQLIFINFSQYKSGISAYMIIENDLIDSYKISKTEKTKDTDTYKEFSKLELRDVDFKYNEKKLILKNINFKINKNQKIGLVGSSGSGKTTLVNLITSLIKPTKGQILIDGKNLSDNCQISGNLFSYVHQDSQIIDGSIIENITLKEKSYNYDRNLLSEAIELSKLDDLFKELSINLETKLGENGTKLSGGQKQRVILARALFKKPKILILDESTNSLDKILENQIIDSLIEYKKDLTLIIISHNLSCLKNCNKIILLKDGLINQIDSFEKLKNENEYFKSLISEKFIAKKDKI